MLCYCHCHCHMLLLVVLLLVDCCLECFCWYCHCTVTNTASLAVAAAMTVRSGQLLNVLGNLLQWVLPPLPLLSQTARVAVAVLKMYCSLLCMISLHKLIVFVPGQLLWREDQSACGGSINLAALHIINLTSASIELQRGTYCGFCT